MDKIEVDMTGWTEDEIKAFNKWGRKPPRKHYARVLGDKDKQHFDSADYEMNKQKEKEKQQKGKYCNITPNFSGYPLSLKKKPIPDNVRNSSNN